MAPKVYLLSVALHLCSAVAATSEAVFITDYLPNRISEGQAATKVDFSQFGWDSKREMHSGFVRIDQTLGKNSFFWYSASLDGNKSAPLLLWLQGGPGASSLFGMFTELGPFQVSDAGQLQERAVSWNQHHNMIFIDNPVGTGFSFTESESGFVSNEVQVGKDLHEALRQFFQLFPQLRSNDFYITGESFAGKYVPACGYTIHQLNQGVAPADRINLKGISIGDGAFDPYYQFNGLGDLLYNVGMADSNERDTFRKYEAAIRSHLDKGEKVEAFGVFDEMLNADFYPYGSYYANVTGMTTNYFNYELAPDATPLGGAFVAFLNRPEVRAQVHVGDRTYAPENQTVETYLKADFVTGVIDFLVPLMENYKVLVYSGQNDIILGPAPTENGLRRIKWSKQEDYLAAKKVVWRRAAHGEGSQLPDVAGYAREVGNFRQVVVRGAGHMVPGDQPERALDMMNRFISGHSFAEAETSAAVSHVLVV